MRVKAMIEDKLVPNRGDTTFCVYMSHFTQCSGISSHKTHITKRYANKETEAYNVQRERYLKIQRERFKDSERERDLKHPLPYAMETYSSINTRSSPP